MAGSSASGSYNNQNASNNQTQTTSLDPNAQWWTNAATSAAQGAGASGPSPLVTGSSNYYTGQMGAGNLGMGALSGDPTAVNQLMNPYQKNVVDATNAQFD